MCSYVLVTGCWEQRTEFSQPKRFQLSPSYGTGFEEVEVSALSNQVFTWFRKYFVRQSNLQKGFGKVYAAVDERGQYFAIKRVPVSPTT